MDGVLLTPGTLDLLQKLLAGGSGLLLLAAIFGAFKGWWYSGAHVSKLVDLYEKRLAEKDALIKREQAEVERWQHTALEAMNVSTAVLGAFREGAPR